MPTIKAKFFCAALAACLSAACGSDADGALLSFQAYLDGLQEVPPNASPGTGFADLTLDDVSGAVSIITGTYNGMIGGATAVTLNGMAPPGSNAPVLFSFTLDTPGLATGTFSGGGTLTNIMQILGMKAGNTYINIRSNVVPAGEIRGQVLEVPEPSAMILFAMGVMCLFGVRWRRRAR